MALSRGGTVMEHGLGKRVESWEMMDDSWQRVEPLMSQLVPSPDKVCVREPARQVFEGIVYVLRTGCQWKALPREYGSGST